MNAPLPPPAEVAQNPDTIEGLHSARQYLCERQANGEMYGFLGSGSQATRVSSGLARISRDGIPNDFQVFGPTDILACEAIGCDSDDLLSKTGRGSGPDNEKFAEVSVTDTLSVSMFRFGEGMYLKASDPRDPASIVDSEPEETETILTAFIRKRLARSPGHQQLRRLYEQYEDTAELPDTLQTEPFDPRQDPLGSLVLLGDIGFDMTLYYSRDLRAGASPLQVIDKIMSKMPNHSTDVEQRPDDTIYTWGKGAKKQLSVDKQTGAWQLTLSKDPAALYPEVANSAPSHESAPFVETECAAELCEWLDAHNLALAPRFMLTMIRPGEADRYGSVYTDLSREVAKWVNRSPSGRTQNIFIPKSEAMDPLELAERYRRFGTTASTSVRIDVPAAHDQTVTQALLETDLDTMHEPAQLLLGIARQALTRDPESAESELAVSASEISITDGACFDVAQYYIGSASDTKYNPWAHDALLHVDVNGVQMLQKNSGAHTWMLLRPTQFNGVTLPKGSLMSRQADGWAFLRLTPLCFDRPADQLATGSELVKAYYNVRKSIQTLGGALLHHVLQGSVPGILSAPPAPASNHSLDYI